MLLYILTPSPPMMAPYIYNSIRRSKCYWCARRFYEATNTEAERLGISRQVCQVKYALVLIGLLGT